MVDLGKCDCTEMVVCRITQELASNKDMGVNGEKGVHRSDTNITRFQVALSATM